MPVLTRFINGVRDQIFPELTFIVLLTEINCLIHVTKFICYQLQSLLCVAHTTYKQHHQQQYVSLPHSTSKCNIHKAAVFKGKLVVVMTKL